MRGWWTPVLLGLVAACSSDNTAPGVPPDVPASRRARRSTAPSRCSGTTMRTRPIPTNFSELPDLQHRPTISITDLCGTTWAAGRNHGRAGVRRRRARQRSPALLRGDAPDPCRRRRERPIAGALDTPRPDSRNVVLFACQFQDAGSGFRFWDDLNGDQQRPRTRSWAWSAPASAADIDFAVERDGTGSVFLTPVRAGTGVEFYDAMCRSRISPRSTSHRDRR